MTSAATAQTDGLADPAIDPGAPSKATSPARTGDDLVPAIVRRRLVPWDRRFDGYSWAATGFVVAIAALLRLVGLADPKGLVFDEVYYATDAYDMLSRGIEWDEKTGGPAYVVHPPLGKWAIALGEAAFGNNEFGWRISAAVAGILSVLILTRLAIRLFGSVILGCSAGLLLALDGFHLVMSRTALLDIFLQLFILAAFAALVLDRDHRRRRWLGAIEQGRVQPTGRVVFAFPGGVPWWRLTAAVLIGCACGVKWSAMSVLPIFFLLVWLWEGGAQRTAGIRWGYLKALPYAFGWSLISGVIIAAVYLATWTGWLATDDGYFRHWLADSGRAEPPVIGALINLWHYHSEAVGFHNQLVTKHPYQSWPWQWLLLGRPVAFFWDGDLPCGASHCAAEVLLLGTPVLWWSFIPALLALIWFGIARRDWRALFILLGAAANFLPWFWFAITEGRTMFSFYVLPSVPFFVLAVAYVLGAIMTPTFASQRLDHEAVLERRKIGAVVLGVYLILVAVCFWYFYPVFVGESIPYSEWSARMWLGSRWI
ncbi:dolichyl-phosphate-mannose--protein mannosyltransferase [Catenuloplanes atrovinosus]|uniref:Polyprenol-phosphate-mannose--protein mannosyltransferase n=1 Tax=Catenuloplanes atrovinosus TaxID=137266 RepID=A0AAE4CGF8_9ACTN|nr:glycosyltransferase family 39 protein [Catenuloplanes atrovinosus]MDR7280650.1 dolichyl-phosphate-mannose--protein O-mannosyl transferase [Catenuloplanes atrovinosus]